MKTSIAIIGAGVAGLACARRLLDPRLDIRLFDKGRSPGGRLATRRIEISSGDVRFDHGAQYIKARDPGFVAFMEGCAAAGAAALWQVEDGSGGDASRGQAQERRWVGAPGMSALPRRMAEGLAIESSVRVTGVRADTTGWRLEVEAADREGARARGSFDAVVIALPAEQAAPLLAPAAPELAKEAAAARTAPCWAGLFAFDRRFNAPFEAHRFGDDEPLAWVAREASKPGRPAAEAWVVHASPGWSRAHIEMTPEQASNELLRMFQAVVPDAPDPVWRAAHRWRYAFVETPASSAFAWDPALRLGVCGDWRLGPRVEAAWVSGDSLGREIYGAFARGTPGPGER